MGIGGPRTYISMVPVAPIRHILSVGPSFSPRWGRLLEARLQIEATSVALLRRPQLTLEPADYSTGVQGIGPVAIETLQGALPLAVRR